MQKLRLTVDDLTVESFATGRNMRQVGTVAGHSDPQTNTEAADCTFGVPCPYDVYATLDAVTCANPTQASCEGETVMALTCRATGWCCDGHTDVTHGTGPICCP